MKIGIIGTGAIGGALAREYAANGHEVRIANSRGPETLTALADEAGATATDAAGAVDGADAVIISIPFVALEQLPDGLLADLPDAVPVIDTCNYYPDVRDPRIAQIDAGKPESVWASEVLKRGVIKAFNNIEAEHLATQGKPRGAADRIALPVAGDDAAQKAVVLALVEEAGFDAFDSGPLEQSWRQQPQTPCYSTDYGLADLARVLSSAVQGVAAQKRDAFLAGAADFWAKYPTAAARTEYFRTFNAAS